MNKKTVISFIWIAFFFCYVEGNATLNVERDSLLYNVQTKIFDAFMASFQDNSPKQLLELETKLKEYPVQNQLTDYWRAYTWYYVAIHYIKSKDREACSKTVDDAIGFLEKTENKNSETYALLAYLQNFSIQFVSGMEAATVSTKIKQNAETALKLDSANIRAWFVMASNDFYTPAAFGGGAKCEEYLLKAVSLNEQPVANPHLPNWGKREAYTMLIGFYVSKNDYPKAREYLNEALRLYPDDYTLNQYVESLKEK